MWDLPGPGLEPVCPALVGGFLTTVPRGKPKGFFSPLSLTISLRFIHVVLCSNSSLGFFFFFWFVCFLLQCKYSVEWFYQNVLSILLVRDILVISSLGLWWMMPVSVFWWTCALICLERSNSSGIAESWGWHRFHYSRYSSMDFWISCS